MSVFLLKRNARSIVAIILAAVCILAASGSAQTLKTLVNFTGTNGSQPYSPPVQGTDGNLYGVTPEGGANGHGTFYRMTPAGTLTTIFSFCQQSNCTDGAGPQGGIILGTDGNFYGTTQYGGTGTAFCGEGCGTVFKITPKGVLTTLHSFCTLSTCTDGYSPIAVLVQGSDGNFYGTVPNGGGSFLQGTVFKITPQGVLTTLYAFCIQSSCSDGETPLAGLVQASNGAFYGTTAHGGAIGWGEIFSITATGAFSVVHSFDSTDGANPSTTLIQDSNGLLYGTTQGGGTSTACFGSSCGTVFDMTTGGTLTSLLSFDDTNGAFPEYAAMVQGTDGDLYGTTGAGGAHEDAGTIYKMTTGGSLTTIYNFCSVGACSDGAGVNAIMQATSGVFYGTTAGGGTSSEGTLWSLTAGQRAFVSPLPATGKVGARVLILGNGFTGATAVSFNGTPATFTVASATLITTTVPTGATTGKISVTKSSGAVTSKAAFVVK